MSRDKNRKAGKKRTFSLSISLWILTQLDDRNFLSLKIGGQWIKVMKRNQTIQVITRNRDRTRKLRQEEGNSGRVACLRRAQPLCEHKKKLASFDVTASLRSPFLSRARVRAILIASTAAVYAAIADKVKDKSLGKM